MILTLEQQVCNLESAKRLKELGVRQESLWHWFVSKSGVKFIGQVHEVRGDFYQYAAFTCAELGELLPLHIDIYKTDHRTWIVVPNQYYERTGVCHEQNTEAEARARMLIYLIDNGIIKNNNLGELK